MMMSFFKIVFSATLLLFVQAVAQDNEVRKTDYIYFETDRYQCRFYAPKGWKFDIENARLDNYSAALFPDTNQYYDSEIIIYIWIFGIKNQTCQKFVSSDSAAYIKDDSNIVFMRSDSVKTASNQNVIYFETADPGGKYELAAVGYIPTGNEIIVYEMNITNRAYFASAQFVFREALSGFSLTELPE